jgi:hypothetical protein
MALAEDKIATVRLNLGDLERILYPDNETIQKALDDENNDPNCATARLLEQIATSKAISPDRVTLGNKLTVEDIDKCLKMALFWRDRAGKEYGTHPPLAGVHTDGTVGDGRPEFDKIGIKDVEEGERSDTEIKPSTTKGIVE